MRIDTVGALRRALEPYDDDTPLVTWDGPAGERGSDMTVEPPDGEYVREINEDCDAQIPSNAVLIPYG